MRETTDDISVERNAYIARRSNTRPRLICRWIVNPATGKLECAWYVDTPPMMEAA